VIKARYRSEVRMAGLQSESAIFHWRSHWLFWPDSVENPLALRFQHNSRGPPPLTQRAIVDYESIYEVDFFTTGVTRGSKGVFQQNRGQARISRPELFRVEQPFKRPQSDSADRPVVEGSRRSHASNSFGEIRWQPSAPLGGNFAMPLSGSFDKSAH